MTDQQDEIEERAHDVLCPRVEEGLVEVSSPQAQGVIGVRRSGKSTLCYNVLHSRGLKFAYVNFDDERLVGLDSSMLNDVLEVLYKIYGDFTYLFMDEVQNVRDWHLFVNRLLRKKMHVVITGSNAKLLSSELATHLSGRSKEITLYPFSFGEFCSVKDVDKQKLSTKAEAFRRAAFDEYLSQGGFPELFAVGDGRSYVNSLVDNILKRDIELRFQVAYKAEFEAMAHHLLNNSPTIVVTKDLARLFGFKSEHTASNYVNYLKQAFVLVGIPKYSTKSHERVVQEKVYAVDVAMMNQRDNAFVGANLGFRLETVVLIHLLRHCKMQGLDVYYFADRQGECDFLVCRGNIVLQAVQVSYDISAEKTKKREIAGLLLVARRSGCKDLLLITDHARDEIEVSGNVVKVVPAYEWCLELGL